MRNNSLHPEIDSFYHLSEMQVGDALCSGLACFAARCLDPGRWQEAKAHRPPVYCLGKCYAGPAIGKEDPQSHIEIRCRRPVLLERIAGGASASLNDYRAFGGFSALEAALLKPPTTVFEIIEASALRGRGGAGFPTGAKWRAAAVQNSDEKYIVANGDEGDPGAFSDRLLMERDPFALLEGMALAAYAIGAAHGYVYVRGEYPKSIVALRTAADVARANKLLGRKIFGSEFSFDVKIVEGRGGYVCGEETSLLNSIQGKRPVAMPRPPYVSERGLFGKPTIVNNVETLASVPWIVRHGADAYCSLGFSASRGTKLISLNSLFNRPGLYEIEFGMTVRQIVEELGGGLRTGRIMMLMIGGPLAGVVPPPRFDVAFGFEELAAIGSCVGHGGIIAFDDTTSVAQLVHEVFAFGAFESCGQCVPCRLGGRRIERIFRQVLEKGSAPAADAEQWKDIAEALRQSSLCGLGSGLGEFAESILRYFPQEVRQCFGS